MNVCTNFEEEEGPQLQMGKQHRESEVLLAREREPRCFPKDRTLRHRQDCLDTLSSLRLLGS